MKGFKISVESLDLFLKILKKKMKKFRLYASLFENYFIN